MDSTQLRISQAQLRISQAQLRISEMEALAIKMDTARRLLDASMFRQGTVESIQTKFLWEIKDFPYNSIEPLNFTIVSPTFNALGFNFDLQLSSNFVYNGERHIRIDLRNLDAANQPHPLVRISLLTNANSDEEFENALHKVRLQDETSTLFYQQAVLSECVKDGTLRVVSTVTSAKIVPIDASEGTPRKRLKLCLETMESFKKIFNKEELSDVVFCVDGRNIYAQKSVLICKSPVFAAMFSGENLENKTNKVDIVDNTYDSMYTLLEYIYTGITDKHVNLDCATCLGVLVAAEKYDLMFLKHIFQEIICDKLATDNVLECIVTADSNNAAYLKQRCINYIVFKSQDIVKLGSFKELLVSHPDLSMEIINVMSTKIVKS